MYWPKNVSPESKRKTMLKPFRSKVGDKVRITYIRNIFKRVYDEKWTGEIFRHTQRIMDFHDEEIKGTFYHKGNTKQYFIKWLHWLNKFNSWISASDVNNL